LKEVRLHLAFYLLVSKYDSDAIVLLFLELG